MPVLSLVPVLSCVEGEATLTTAFLTPVLSLVEVTLADLTFLKLSTFLFFKLPRLSPLLGAFIFEALSALGTDFLTFKLSNFATLDFGIIFLIDFLIVFTDLASDILLLGILI